MGRQPTWSEEELLGAAMGVFRRKGFAHTTVRDLQEVTGLHPGSLYNAYGSKEGLFAAALCAYNERVVDRRVATHLSREDDPLKGIRSFFTSTFERCEWPDPGCLVTNTAIEGVGLDPAARAHVWVGLERIERGLEEALRRGQAGGQLPASPPAAALAARLLTLYQGLLVLVRSGAPRPKLRAIVDDAMQSLTPSRTKGRRQ